MSLVFSRVGAELTNRKCGMSGVESLILLHRSPPCVPVAILVYTNDREETVSADMAL